jgi:hypothetical protein
VGKSLTFHPPFESLHFPYEYTYFKASVSKCASLQMSVLLFIERTEQEDNLQVKAHWDHTKTQHEMSEAQGEVFQQPYVEHKEEAIKVH